MIRIFRHQILHPNYVPHILEKGARRTVVDATVSRGVVGKVLCVAVLALAMGLFGANAYACPTDAQQVKEADLANPPEGMLAFKGRIERISRHGRIGAKPHDGFQIEFAVVEVFQGDLPDRSIRVEFGVCHNLPGKTGDVIPVLTLQDKDGNWYAPQFWERRAPKK